jgi:hypothetical protein
MENIMLHYQLRMSNSLLYKEWSLLVRCKAICFTLFIVYPCFPMTIYKAKFSPNDTSQCHLFISTIYCL